mmetsp:Transcript_87678/g.249456  ORF Transcript_87678/g.249456 Transcript_87678/m.249456 type:complete len:80 (+) Transcript_87678:167-406(+)
MRDGVCSVECCGGDGGDGGGTGEQVHDQLAAVTDEAVLILHVCEDLGSFRLEHGGTSCRGRCGGGRVGSDALLTRRMVV